MIKSLFVVLLYSIIAWQAAFAQTQSNSQTATVNLTVQSAMTLTNVSPLDFGSQVQGATNVTVDPVTGGSNTASFTLTGAPGNQTLQVSWTASANLTFGATNVPWTPAVAVNNTSTQSGATTISSGGTKDADASGDLWLWVGGTISSIPAAAPAGAYTGTITLTVQY